MVIRGLFTQLLEEKTDASGGSSGPASVLDGYDGDSGSDSDDGDDSGDDGDADDDKTSEDESDDDDESVGDEDEVDADEDEEDSEDEVQRKKEQENALSLYKLLSDPKTSQEAIRLLAQNAGFSIADASKAQTAEFASQVHKVLQEELGDDAYHVPDKMANALARLLKENNSEAEALKQKVERLEAKLTERDNNTQRERVVKAVDWAEKELPGFKANHDLIFAKMQKLHPAPGQSYKSYLRDIHSLVVKPDAEARRTARIKKNADGRLPSDGVPKDRLTTNVPAKTYQEAAERAYDTVFAKHKKGK